MSRGLSEGLQEGLHRSLNFIYLIFPETLYIAKTFLRGILLGCCPMYPTAICAWAQPRVSLVLEVFYIPKLCLLSGYIPLVSYAIVLRNAFSGRKCPFAGAAYSREIDSFAGSSEYVRHAQSIKGGRWMAHLLEATGTKICGRILILL